MIDYLSEIPLPGRVLAPAPARTDSRALQASSLGFVAGEENHLVASAVNRLMLSVPSPFASRMIALFGPSGTGKTHLAHGLVRYWRQQRGAGSAAYYTAGDFYRQLIDAIKRNAVVDCRRALRGHELLAIDDLHYLPSDDYVSQELRCTLDAYEESGGTLIVTSLRPANTLTNISADVRSRLSSGPVLQLAPPGKAARVRIIRRAAESLGRPLSDEAANCLASGLQGTANELFGVVFELCTSTTDLPRDDLARAERLLGSRLARRPDLRKILAVVARYFGLPQAQLRGHSRRKSIVSARAMTVYLARELAGATYEQIGRALGGRDHTTMIHSYRKINRDRSHDPLLQETIDQLNRALCGR